MSDKGDVDLTGAKQNAGVWLVKVSVFSLVKSVASANAARKCCFTTRFMLF